MVWDKKGLAVLESMKQEINNEQKDTTAWFKLSAAERLARQSMLEAIEAIEQEEAANQESL